MASQIPTLRSVSLAPCHRRIGRQFEGERGRVFHRDCCFDPRDIVMREIRGEFDKDSHGKTISLTGRETGAIFVAGMGLKVMPLTAIVSTQADLRDNIWTLVQANASHNVRFLELEYQPCCVAVLAVQSL